MHTCVIRGKQRENQEEGKSLVKAVKARVRMEGGNGVINSSEIKCESRNSIIIILSIKGVP